MIRCCISSILSLSILVGCGSVTRNGIAGGFTGGAVGAGAGALVGSMIANGDVVRSALLGGAIGIPAGIAMGVVLSAYDSRVQEQKLLDQYVENQSSIIEQEAEIQRLRLEVLEEAPGNPYYNSNHRHLYHGIVSGTH